MKARESGMPEEEMWDGFFNVKNILNELGVGSGVEKLVDLGCGYGTFTIAAAGKIKGQVFAFDIEEELVQALDAKLKNINVNNVNVINRDFIARGTGLENEEADFVFLFNILHAEESAAILQEAYRILKKNGKAGIIHWKYDNSTPRGPSMPIRPRPEDLRSLLIKTGFSVIKYNISLPPYHYGILAQKTE